MRAFRAKLPLAATTAAPDVSLLHAYRGPTVIPFAQPVPPFQPSNHGTIQKALEYIGDFSLNWPNLLLLLALAVATSPPARHSVRCTGRTAALRSSVIQVPRQYGSFAQLTLLTIVQNGVQAKPGDLLAEFDATDQLKQARDALAKFDDLSHQVDQKRAEQKNNAEKRNSDLIQAEADLKKAEIDIQKGPVLSDLDQQKNTVKLEDARAHVASLERSNHFHDQAEAAELRILELQRDRQKLTVERQKENASLLTIRSSISGMVALENTWRGNGMGHAQEGDRLYPGEPLLQVFDPSNMVVLLSVGEPDGAALKPGVKAVIHLDAFPDLTFTAHFESASPVATSAFDTQVKKFTARFVVDQSDARLLPDLSVAADIEVTN
jgi:multidrug resistance efflux pump